MSLNCLKFISSYLTNVIKSNEINLAHPTDHWPVTSPLPLQKCLCVCGFVWEWRLVLFIILGIIISHWVKIRNKLIRNKWHCHGFGWVNIKYDNQIDSVTVTDSVEVLTARLITAQLYICQIIHTSLSILSPVQRLC